MRALLLSIKNGSLPLASSIALHAVVISGLIAVSSVSPGGSGGTQEVIDVRFEGTGLGVREGAAAVTVGGSERSPELIAARNETLVPDDTVQLSKRLRRERAPERPHHRPAESERAEHVAASAPLGSLGTGGGSGGGNGSGNGGEGEGPPLSGFVRAVPLDAPKPPFPDAARGSGFSGKVVLRASINQEGRVDNAVVVETSGRSDCDSAASDTLKERWTFAPARMNGTPVASSERVVVVYRLNH